jgi:transposase
MAADEKLARSNVKDSSERKGVFTSGIVSRKAGRDIALFFTGKRHAGENLGEVLRQRAAELDTPIQMCDALSRNLPHAFKVILANCLSHSRRRFVDVLEEFPQACRYVIETLAEVYWYDAITSEKGMSPQERLQFHQEKSAPLMADLDRWLVDQIEGKKVEPNSGLGDAITYAIDHWEKLTRFLHVAGAPLDNNIVERALKKSILRRKNSLFYKTQNGAQVGDTFTSLIYTCQLAGVDPFHYLTEIQKHAAELAANPREWMPWSYRETLARLRDA